MTPVRGQVLQVEVGLDEPKLFLIVSNNDRNRRLGHYLGVRLTTTAPKIPREAIVELPRSERLTGHALCDEITIFWDDEVRSVRGAVSPGTMRLIDRGLAAALSLTLAH